MFTLSHRLGYARLEDKYIRPSSLLSHDTAVVADHDDARAGPVLSGSIGSSLLILDVFDVDAVLISYCLGRAGIEPE